MKRLSLLIPLIAMMVALCLPSRGECQHWTPVRNVFERLRLYPPPQPAPFRPQTISGSEVQSYGVLPDPTGVAGERWSFSGSPVTATEGKSILSAPLPDDSKKGWLIGVGDDAFQSRFLADCASNPQTVQRRVKALSPDDWSCKDRTGKLAFTPGVWIMDPDGKNPKRIAPEDYTARQLASALRQCQPGYDPAQVPSPASPLNDYAIPAGGALTGLAAVAGSLLKKAVS